MPTETLPDIGIKPDIGVEREAGSKGEDRHDPLFNVVLIDDDFHSYDYVIEMLNRLFLISKADAFRKAVEVDTNGRVIVITCERPQAEFGRDQIHGYGADPRMVESKGPMSAVIEPAGSTV